METTYYICLNKHCEKRHNIFVEGDPQHAECKREVLRFGETAARPAPWMWLAIPAGIAVIVAALRFARRKRVAKPEFDQAGSWESGRTGKEPRGSSIPPPIEARR
jgi:hypothetical protein